MTQAQIEANPLRWFLLPAGTGCHAWCAMFVRGCKTLVITVPIWLVITLITVVGCAIGGNDMGQVFHGKECTTNWLGLTLISDAHVIAYSIVTMYLIWEAARNDQAHDPATLQMVEEAMNQPLCEDDEHKTEAQ